MQLNSFGQPDVGARLDRLPVTVLHGVALSLCALGFGFDLMEIALGSMLSAVFSAPPHIAAPAQLSSLLAAVYVGAAIGAPLFGWLADRHGRRNTLCMLLLLLALTSAGAAHSSGIAELTWWRGLAGLALGAYPPLVISYLTDLLPARRRGLLIFIMVALAGLGAPAGLFLVRGLTPLQPLGIEAWRWGFIVGGAGAALVGVLLRALPESPRWLASAGRHAAALSATERFERSATLLEALPPLPSVADANAAEVKRAGSVMAGADAETGRPRWLQIGALFFLSPWSTVAFPLLSGAILMQKGYRLSDTLLFVGLSMCGPFLGTLLLAFGIDRIERRSALLLGAGCMLATGLWFVLSDTPVWLIWSSVGFQVATSVYVSSLSLYSAELFPTRTRAASVASAWALNRVGAALAPFLLLPLLRGSGPLAMFGVIAATLMASVLLLAYAPRGRASRGVA